MIPTPMDSFARTFGGPAFARPAPIDSFVSRRNMLGQTFDQMMALPAWTGDAIRLMVHGSTGVLGIYVGTLDKGLWSTLGWIVGVVSSFAALLDICSLISRAFGKE